MALMAVITATILLVRGPEYLLYCLEIVCIARVGRFPFTIVVTCITHLTRT